MGAKDGNFLVDFALGGFSGAIAKTITAPIERIKLVVQTQDANQKIRSGEVQPVFPHWWYILSHR